MNDDLTMSDIEMRMLSKLAAMSLDEVLDEAIRQWRHINELAGASIARALILADAGKIPSHDAELRLLLVLAYRASALGHLLTHIRNDPELRSALEHDDAQIASLLERCMAENLKLRETASAVAPP